MSSVLGRFLSSADKKVSASIVKAVDQPAVSTALLRLGKLGRIGYRRAREAHDLVAHGLAVPSRRDAERLENRIALVDAKVSEILAQLDDARRDDARRHDT